MSDEASALLPTAAATTTSVGVATAAGTTITRMYCGEMASTAKDDDSTTRPTTTTSSRSTKPLCKSRFGKEQVMNQCEICKRRFNQNSSLKRHKKNQDCRKDKKEAIAEKKKVKHGGNQAKWEAQKQEAMAARNKKRIAKAEGKWVCVNTICVVNVYPYISIVN